MADLDQRQRSRNGATGRKGQNHGQRDDCQRTL